MARKTISSNKRVADQGFPNRQFMTPAIRENGVTLPSVRTNCTEMSGPIKKRKQKKRSSASGRAQKSLPDAGLPGRVPARDCAPFSGRGLQPHGASSAVRR